MTDRELERNIYAYVFLKNADFHIIIKLTRTTYLVFVSALVVTHIFIIIRYVLLPINPYLLC